MKKIIVLASGNGSNFEALKNENINITHLICNKKNAYVIERAKKLKVPYTIISEKNKIIYNKKLFEKLKNLKFDLIVLAGYMKILPPEIVNYYKNKIVNIHPSLLPAFPGTHSIEKAYNYGVKYTGVTIHYVDEGMDTGKIIEQEIIKIDYTKNIDALETQIHIIEHKIYPKIIKKLLNI
ncbi:phosphoribosylglycinamide formyltransferase [Tepiditoga spiralis]|uniref:Phosphoribosylglycinamide formyltransferase n=1 Tax=Tepiditoga spiralis TaxID=2108365 RepID=A0A7G1GAL4_9BACT|nr:phosphoribosylglycinamide formyltransferase [Tepiditoga spiralis]BBE31212.1 phosphoribosylglycinamide formyltransferase [Tepiditoga spiralis]